MNKEELYTFSEEDLKSLEETQYIDLCDPDTFVHMLDNNSWNTKCSLDIAFVLINSPYSRWNNYNDLFALAKVYAEYMYHQGTISVECITFTEMQFISDLTCWLLVNGDIENLMEFIDGYRN